MTSPPSMSMPPSLTDSPSLLTMSSHGLHCVAGGFHIDPMRAVEHAVITHAHSDHARRGSKHYYCAAPGEGLLRERIGQEARITAVPFGKSFRIKANGDAVELSFHSAGHILGSAQLRMRYRGETWVMSGDYKRDSDPTCPPFEVVPCDTFVTEATFGIPIYRWPEVSQVALEILDWWRANAARDVNSVLYCYSLGKSQRVLAELAPHLGPDEKILVHDSIEPLNRAYREQGVRLAACETVSNQQGGARIQGALVLAPPGIQGTPLMRRLGEFETGFASGWMRVRKARFSRRYDRSFVFSDHADWPSLVRTVRETGARRVYVMHGSNEILARYLREVMGLDARSIEEMPRSEYALPSPAVSPLRTAGHGSRSGGDLGKSAARRGAR